MLGSTTIDYVAGLCIAGALGRGEILPLSPRAPRTHRQKLALALSLVSNLSLLGFFKYFNFGIENYNALIAACGLEAWHLDTALRVTLPLGISFYTFQSMSYTIDPATGQATVIKLTRRQAARLDRHFALRLDGGSCVAAAADARLLEACRASNALSIEATLTPANGTQEGPARIVTFSSDPSSRNFTLGQHRDRLILRLRTTQTGLNGTEPEVDLCPIEADHTYHVIVTYADGRLGCYVDGAKVLDTSVIQGDFSNWDPQHLMFGDEWTGQRDWAGTIEGVALIARALTEYEVRCEYQAYQRILALRLSASRVVIDAELIEMSRIPTLKEILPYRDALLVAAYRVTQVVTGQLETQTVRVAHWALLDGEPTGPASRKPGWSGRLGLEIFTENPQLKSLFINDTLPDDFAAILYLRCVQMKTCVTSPRYGRIDTR